MTSVDLLMHPVRLRLVQALLGDEEVTTRVLAQRLSDVAPATLYRHIAALVDGGVIEIVDERRVRGAVERTLRLHASRASINAGDPVLGDDAAMRAGFLAYLASLAGTFDQYLARTPHDLAADLVSFRQVAVHATDDEWLELLTEVRGSIEKLSHRTTPEGARRRVLATISLPVD